MEIDENSEQRYFKGWINYTIRLYYYLQEGLAQVNQAKNVILGLAAFAVLTRIEKQYWLIGLIGLSLVPVLILLGWMWVKRARKSIEYFNIKYTSTFGKYGVEMQEKQIKQQAEVIELLKKIANG